VGIAHHIDDILRWAMPTLQKITASLGRGWCRLNQRSFSRRPLTGLEVEVRPTAAELADGDDVAAGFLFVMAREMEVLAELEPHDEAPHEGE
jgi:hypothetical protein